MLYVLLYITLMYTYREDIWYYKVVYFCVLFILRAELYNWNATRKGIKRPLLISILQTSVMINYVTYKWCIFHFENCNLPLGIWFYFTCNFISYSTADHLLWNFQKNKLINGHELQASIKLLHSELKQYHPLQSSTKYTNSYFPKMFFCVHILLSRNLLSKYDIRWNVKANAWKFNPRVKGISLSSD